MTAPPFDRVKYKETTLALWQSAAEAWHRWNPVIHAWVGPATEVMLDLARIGPGSRVLDLAAGDGDQSFAAARRVGPGGHVLATDLAPNLMAIAARSAREAGLAQVEARVMDAERLDVADGSFDAVICRLGLFFFGDLPRALAEARRALRPGGWLAALVFSTPDKNPFFAIPISIIRRRARLPEPGPGRPGPFSLGGPGVFEAALTSAGFRDVETRALSASLRTASAAECLRFQRESFGALHQMMVGLSEGERRETWDEIGEGLRAYEGPGGFESPCELIAGAGAK